MTPAHLYDGASAVRHEVAVAADGAGLRLSIPGEWEEQVPLAELALAERSRAGLTLVRPAVQGWRLRLAAPVPPEIDRLFPRRHGYGGWIDRIGLWWAVAACGAISAGVLAFGYFAPTLLAPLVPPSVERAYGAVLVGNFGGKYCSSPAGDAALRKLTAELDPHPEDLNVRVVDVPVVNAAALPAGNIMIFDKLFETVQGPDELAGILAHEIAHVRHRHITAALLREFGVGVFTTALGGTTAGRVDGFVSLSFTRRAEADADQGAIAMLKRADISPAPTAAFFRRLGGLEGKAGRFEPALAYLSSHPLSSAREKKFEGAAIKGASYRPALTPREWADLRAICSSRPRSGD
ncbi:M48 family metalloprotease [Sphingomonas sp. MAH-20]|uniref:M48 family metalloprotease n=1 Tax=Sphingomonas horti TaxID=2682842 RepID=A0A6I4IXV0_9SPHN|nr:MULTISPECIES: M48 family metallopeptidase [Sphingomonas]MBA2920941.1 M48 family metallopeptidase [Sphingomonas sp. CGMCC 1.13658]MVO76927.1 M48 family metalloprotease [Sphingomonas horti]